jgi:hypothetical protein
MTTEIVILRADLRRPYNFDTLADIVPTETPRLPKSPTGDLVVTFTATLTAQQIAAIRTRLTTVSDAAATAEAAEAAALTDLLAAAAALRDYVPPTMPDSPTTTQLKTAADQLTSKSTALSAALATYATRITS